MSQNNLVLPTSGTLSGLAAVQAVNAAVDTLNTLASGASAPSSPEAGQLWHDTGNKLIKIRSMDNTTWITIGTLDESAYTFKAAGLSSILDIAHGGTGASTQAAALAAILGVSTIPQANIGGNFTFAGSATGWYLSIPYGSGSGKFLLQGGSPGGVPNGTNSTSFPLAFPNACLGVFPAFDANSNIGNAVFTLISRSQSGFSFYNQSAGAAVMTYIAAGY